LQDINIEEYLRNPLTRLIFEIWWNFIYDLFSIKNVADVNSIDSFVSKRNMEEFSVVIMKRFKELGTAMPSVAMITSKGWDICQVLDATKST
jgi:hypothetical protein